MPDTQPTALLTAAATPFADHEVHDEGGPESVGLLPWTETPSPFADRGAVGLEFEDEQTELLLETFDELRDESFDAALAQLVAETSEAAGIQVHGEQPDAFGAQRQRLAQAHLDPIVTEAERCVQRLIEHVGHVDPSSISQGELESLLERFDPGQATVSPAGEQFLGGLIKKVKGVVKKVTDVAKKVVSKIPFLGAILKKIKALIKPLLKRVLGMAIGRLPSALQQPARDLAKKLGIGELEDESFDQLEDEAEEETLSEDFAGSPVQVLDPETLGESFDAAVAGAIVSPEALEEGEAFGRRRGPRPRHGHGAGATGRRQGPLHEPGAGRRRRPGSRPRHGAVHPGHPPRAQARAAACRALEGGQLPGEVPRDPHREVGGPAGSVPLSRALVDVGLRVIGLENGGTGELEAEAAPAMLAATVEDTVRRLAEQPDHVLEDEGLLQVAVAEAFEQSVAANFPATLVRPDLRLAPSLGGTFVTRHARTRTPTRSSLGLPRSTSPRLRPQPSGPSGA